jgi:hypothetical protein
MRKRLGATFRFQAKKVLKHYSYAAPAKITAYFRVASNLGIETSGQLNI